MNKKIVALFAAFSMIATASVGLVQTAYAADASIRVEVADGAAENEKVLTYYYENIDGIMDAQFYLDVVEGVTINGVTITVSGQDNDCGVEFDDETQLPYAYYILSNGGKKIASDDGAFLTATITVPGDKDVTVTLTPDAFRDDAGTNYDIAPVEVTIPKKSAPIPQKVDAAVTAVEKQNTEAINGTGQYKSQTADIWGVEITPNDDSVTGATVSIGGQSKDLNFKTVCSGEGTVVFAVILASETGAALPALTEANVTPITAEVE